jgi:hypothetical protein
MFLHGAVPYEVNLEGPRKGFAIFDGDGSPVFFNVADPRRVDGRCAIIDPTFSGRRQRRPASNYPRASPGDT